MRYINRLEKPQILIDNERNWRDSFIASGKDRPSSAQYGHKKIKEALGNSSSYKCFYSEVLFNDLSEAQVDHYVEVAEDQTKAFEWENLYLSCKDSNQGKPSNLSLPNTDCLDPCTDSDEEIEEHLYFEDEVIKGATEKGRNTIRKYRLDKPSFNTLRSKELRKLDKIIRNRALQGLPIDEEFKRKLIRFSNPSSAFSLMFRLFFKENGLM